MGIGKIDSKKTPVSVCRDLWQRLALTALQPSYFHGTGRDSCGKSEYAGVAVSWPASLQVFGRGKNFFIVLSFPVAEFSLASVVSLPQQRLPACVRVLHSCVRVKGNTHLFLFRNAVPADKDTVTFLQLPVIGLLYQEIQLCTQFPSQIINPALFNRISWAVILLWLNIHMQIDLYLLCGQLRIPGPAAYIKS